MRKRESNVESKYEKDDSWMKKVYYRSHCEWHEKDTLYKSYSLLPLSWVTANAFDAFAIYFHFFSFLSTAIDDNVILWHWNRKNDTLMRLRPYWTESFDYVIASIRLQNIRHHNRRYIYWTIVLIVVWLRKSFGCFVILLAHDTYHISNKLRLNG